MLDVKNVDEVFQIIDDNFADFTLESETVSINEAINRISAADIVASEDIPGFNRSSVDGYAVVSSDTFGASETLPAQIQLAGEVKMGEKPGFSLKPGLAAYVPTGGELPGNADSVVMIEYTEDMGDEFIYINKSSAPGANVVFKGDDVKNGDAVVEADTRLRPQDIGVLAAMGYSTVQVKRKIRVGIISTGDEIIDINDKPVGSQVRDVNSYTLYSALLNHGVEPKLYGVVKDNFEDIRATVGKALGECDVTLVSGGSSMGNKDQTIKVIDSLGQPGALIHGIAVKPGKPTILGKVQGKAVIGLPGHPASAYMIFKIFVLHLIDKINGIQGLSEPDLRAEMICNYPSNNGREEFLPVKLEKRDGKTYAEPVFGKSGLITMLSASDGYVHISRGSEGINMGAEVSVRLF